MGYYISITEAGFEIPETEEVLTVLKEANTKFHDWKRGGSWSGGEEKDKWFSWMPSKYDEMVTSVAEVFQMLGFTTENKDGKVLLTDYDSKVGQEELFLALVAPFVEEGSFINWMGEDGNKWRNEVIDGRLHSAEAHTSYGKFHQYELAEVDMKKVNDEYVTRFILCDPYSDTPPAEQYRRQMEMAL